MMFGTASFGGGLWILCLVPDFLYVALLLLLEGAFSTSAFILRTILCGAVYCYGYV